MGLLDSGFNPPFGRVYPESAPTTGAIRVIGAEKVAAKIDNMAFILPGAMEEAQDLALEHLLMTMPDYPPPIAGSSYERTGRLRQALTSRADEDPMSLSHVEVLSRDVVTLFIGVGGYGPWVVHQPTQVPVHRGRWFTLERFVQVSMPALRRFYYNAAAVAKRRAGIS